MKYTIIGYLKRFKSFKQSQLDLQKKTKEATSQPALKEYYQNGIDRLKDQIQLLSDCIEYMEEIEDRLDED